MPWVPKASIDESAAAPGGDVAATEPKGDGGKKGGKAGGKKGKSKSKKEEPLEVPPPPPVPVEGKKGGSKGKGKGKSGKPKGAEAEKGGNDFYPPYRDDDEDSSAGKRGGGGKGGKKGKGKGGGAKGSRNDDDGVERAEKPERNNRSDDSRRQAALQKGRHCDVRKHSSMGCAIVTFEDPTVRDMVLKESLTATIGGIQVKLKPHFDKEAKENVPTDLFVGWGRQVEKATPLSESKLVEYFDSKHEEFVRMDPTALHSLQMQAMQRQLAAGTAGRAGVTPGSVPQVSSASTASRVPSSMANAALLQQQQQALQVQQQQQWLAQMQQAQAYYYYMLQQQQAMAYAAAHQQQAGLHEQPQEQRDRTQQRASNRIKPAYRRPTDEELQATIGALSEKAQSSS
mmetsp:Transcript_46711/g.85539  ORF Transcript_46711/g.85539 Transcript_46711/m.85539 type:complete len:399 (+) Transcript_46711:148-1344(+)